MYKDKMRFINLPRLFFGMAILLSVVLWNFFITGNQRSVIVALFFFACIFWGLLFLLLWSATKSVISESLIGWNCKCQTLTDTVYPVGWCASRCIIEHVVWRPCFQHLTHEGQLSGVVGIVISRQQDLPEDVVFLCMRKRCKQVRRPVFGHIFQQPVKILF